MGSEAHAAQIYCCTWPTQPGFLPVHGSGTDLEFRVVVMIQKPLSHCSLYVATYTQSVKILRYFGYERRRFFVGSTILGAHSDLPHLTVMLLSGLPHLSW